jgi:hypothetical protein
MSDHHASAEQYGTSLSTCDYIAAHQLATCRPASIVDFGAGAGKYGQLAREVLGSGIQVTAVEGYARTARMLEGQKIYSHVDNQLIQDWLATNSRHYDMAIFGDVLEHLTPKQIHQVIRRCLSTFKNILIVCPLHEIFQDEAYGNALEVHHSYVTESFFDSYEIVEKHLVRSGPWLMMNVLIDTQSQPMEGWTRLARRLFHYTILVLQPFGAARPLVSFLKKHLLRYKWILGRSSSPEK